MHNQIVSYSLSQNGNPWWVALHMSSVTYEVQINQSTGNVLIGMGMAHSMNEKVSVEEFLEDSKLCGRIAMNFNQETLDHILAVCKTVVKEKV